VEGHLAAAPLDEAERAVDPHLVGAGGVVVDGVQLHPAPHDPGRQIGVGVPDRIQAAARGDGDHQECTVVGMNVCFTERSSRPG
jgi:hypothetical protein